MSANPSNLDETLDKIFEPLMWHVNSHEDMKEWKEARAQINKLLLQARIDEYENHMPCTKYPNHYQVDRKRLEQRIADLTEQRDKDEY